MTTPPAAVPLAATNPLRVVATLTVAGLLSGLSLAGVYLVTRARIEQNRAEALERAVLAVVPGAASFTRLRDGAPVYATRGADGLAGGFAIVAEGPGFADTIKLMVGFDPVRRQVTGMRVLESRETPGLGDKIITDAAFVDRFEGLAVDPDIVAITTGRATHDNEIDCITGATISSRAVIGIVGASVRRWAAELASPSPGAKGAP